MLSRSLLLLCILAVAAMAQVSTSTLAGTVADESGSAIPNAKVTALLEGTGQQRESTTNEAGEYVIPQLPPGRYKITVQAAGFQTAVLDDVILSIAQRGAANITLRVGQVTETMNITERPPLTETETASLGQVITRRAIVDLPLNGRNYITLGSLSPGVTPQIPAATGPASFVGATTARPDRSILVGGQRESSTSYLYDGIELRNPRVGDSAMTPSLDVVQEFKIQRNFFQAEFGNSPGIINIASRGGTNEYHGSVFWFLRNNAMDARNFFAPSVEPFKRNQFGFFAGGPVIKNKLFVFGNYEGFRQRLGVIARGIFPTQTQLAGDFTGRPTIYDPLTFGQAGPNTRLPFAGNRIPDTRINRISRNFFPYIPVTNNPVVGGANLQGTPVQILDDNQYNVRADWLINSNHSLFGRYSWQNAPLIPASLTPLGGSQVDSKAYNAVVQLTSTLRPNLVNVLRASYSYATLFGKQVPVDRDIAAEIGITGVSTVPLNWGVPNVAWNGYSGIGSNGLTQGNVVHNYQLQDSLTWIKGGHTIKAGYEIRQSRNLNDSDNGPRGSFTFGASYTAALDPATGNPVTGTGEPVADFLLGSVLNMSGAVGTSLTHLQFWTHNLYVQDDWRVSRELTLNYGLRWEYIGPPAPIDQELGHVYGFDFQTGKQLFPTLGQVRNSILEPDYRNLAPRFGFAYNPKWANSWVFRGGAGIYFDQTQMNEAQFITNGPPIFRQQNLNATGRGLPEYEFGRNTLPVVAVPPVDYNYVTPPLTNLFAQEIRGRKPRVYMWTFSIQKSLGANWVAEAAYVGSKGVRLSKRYNSYANATPGILYDVTPGVANYYPSLTGMLYSSQSGWSKFHALNLRLERRFENGLSLLGAYTFAKSIDTDSGGSFGTPNLNPANFQLDVGPSDFDINHRVVASVVYELPFGRGKKWGSDINRAADLLIGGWQVNAIPSWQSGIKRNVTAPNLTTISFITQRADYTGVDMYSSFNGITPREDFGGSNPGRFWFNPAAFSATAPLKFGTSGRTIMVGPAWTNFDLSAFKNFTIREGMILQFRAEAFNAFNNVQFNPPEVNIAAVTFGTLQSAQRPRVMQMALRFTF